MLSFLLFSESTRHLLHCFGLDLRSKLVGRAADDYAVLNKALDEPVTLTWAMSTRSDTSGTEVVVTVIANAAMKVFVGSGLVASVAVHRPRVRRRSWWLLHTESKLACAREAGELSEEV